jgi:uncharacterized membrane protein YkoI
MFAWEAVAIIQRKETAMTTTNARPKRLLALALAALISIGLMFGAAAMANPGEAYADGISLSKAQTIALKNAKVKKSKVAFTELGFSIYRGYKVYDVEFVTTKKEYEYKIKASNGKIVKKDVDKLSKKEKKKAKKLIKAKKAKHISADRAKAIALKKAGLTGKAVKYTKVKLEIGSKKMTYEVEFVYGNYEYEVEINAKTGSIRDYDKDHR